MARISTLMLYIQSLKYRLPISLYRKKIIIYILKFSSLFYENVSKYFYYDTTIKKASGKL